MDIKNNEHLRMTSIFSHNTAAGGSVLWKIKIIPEGSVSYPRSMPATKLVLFSNRSNGCQARFCELKASFLMCFVV